MKTKKERSNSSSTIKKSSDTYSDFLGSVLYLFWAFSPSHLLKYILNELYMVRTDMQKFSVNLDFLMYACGSKTFKIIWFLH